MMINYGKTCRVLMLALLVLPVGALGAAPISTIAQGNMVFLGEEGLDITAAMGGDTRIGWWASAADISTSAPSYSIQIADPAAFFISPTEFSGRLGPWYRLDSAGSADGSAFTVTDPNLDIRVLDATVGVDATSNGWITAGDEVEFKISTNLYQMTQRAGVAGAPITIKVQSPDGAIYSALANRNGAYTGIVEMPVSTSPHLTGAIWDTGRTDAYPFGTYRIWAECNANSMKDNYDMPGKTYTPQSSLLDQERNPLIGVSTRTAAPTTAATSLPTTVKTTAATPVPTTVTTVPTTLPATSQETPTTIPATATKTKSPGFEAVLAGSALLLALAWSIRKD